MPTIQVISTRRWRKKPSRLAPAEMCARGGRAHHAQLPKGSPAPVYIIGTEVPIPGGEQAEQAGIAVTKTADAQRTIEISRDAFISCGLERAWERVIGVVVQPGVEFSDSHVFGYERKNAKSLSKMIQKHKNLVYEAHSTDYQTPQALRELVQDHFAILKVGPWLTFAFREALFALAQIEKETLAHKSGITLSRLPEVLEEVMLENPGYWKPYYHGDEAAQRFARKFSYSDRSRYYWPVPKLEAAVNQLIANLTAHPVPLTLLTQFLPRQYDAVSRWLPGQRPKGVDSQQDHGSGGLLCQSVPAGFASGAQSVRRHCPRNPPAACTQARPQVMPASMQRAELASRVARRGKWKPASKLSPAPVVSTTVTGVASTSDVQTFSPINATAPLAPRLMTTPQPKSASFLPACMTSSTPAIALASASLGRNQSTRGSSSFTPSH